MTAAAPTATSRPHVRRLALARALSFSGSYAARIGLVYELYERTGSSAWVSAALLADVGVLGALGPVAGWIGDHLERRRVMVLAELAAAAVFVLLCLADAPWLLVAGFLAATVVNAPFAPASAAALPNLAGEGDLRWANSMLALSTNAGLVVGPMVGGWLVAASGLRLVFAVNAVSFAASGLLIARIPGRFEQADRPHADADRRGALRAGFSLVRRNRVIGTITAALALTHLTFGFAVVADPALATEFDAGSFGYAVLYTGWGLVALLGAWLAGRVHDPRHVPWAVLGGLGMTALGCVAIATLPNFWLLVGLGSLGGIGTGAMFPLTQGLVQEHAPDAVRARVFGAVDTIDKTVFAAGMLAGAPLVAALGGQGTYGVTAAVLVLALACMAGLPRAVGTHRARPVVTGA